MSGLFLFVRSLALLCELPKCIGQIASGAFDTVGGQFRASTSSGRTQADDGERRLDLLSQTVCLIFGFLFCAGFLL